MQYTGFLAPQTDISNILRIVNQPACSPSGFVNFKGVRKHVLCYIEFCLNEFGLTCLACVQVKIIFFSCFQNCGSYF